MNKQKITESLKNINRDNKFKSLEEAVGMPMGRRTEKVPLKVVAIFELKKFHNDPETNEVIDIEHMKIQVYNDKDVQFSYKNGNSKMKHSSPIGMDYVNQIERSIKKEGKLPTGLKGLSWYDKNFFNNDLTIKGA